MSVESLSPIDTMFETLVGTPEARASYYAALSDGVRRSNDHELSPYDHLAKTSNSLSRDALSKVVSPVWQKSQLYSLVDSASLGQYAHVGCLEAVGNLYVAQAEVPQLENTVRKSLEAVTRHVFAIAYCGSIPAGFMNLNALKDGIDPASASGNGIGFTYLLATRRPVSASSFDSNMDLDGQLDVSPRYRVHKSELLFGACPATHARIEVDGKKQSALRISMDIVSEVALREIYPELFDIEFDLPASASTASTASAGEAATTETAGA